MANKEKYVDWLRDIVAAGNEYTKLFNLMLDRNFEAYIGNDSNRAEDGLDLRFEFEEEYGIIREFVGKPCSELEMFIALARRCETDIMAENDGIDRTFKWFWVMMDNLKLTRCANFGFNVPLVNRILDKFERRNYNFDGTAGGAWVVHNPREDLRNVEIWYQMQWFLVENYEF